MHQERQAQAPAAAGSVRIFSPLGLEVHVPVAGVEAAHEIMRRFGAQGWTPGDVPPGGYVLPYAMADTFDFSLIGAREYEHEGERRLEHRGLTYKRRDMAAVTTGQKKPAQITYSRGAKAFDDPRVVEGAVGDNKGYVTLIRFRGWGQGIDLFRKPRARHLAPAPAPQEQKPAERAAPPPAARQAAQPPPAAPTAAQAPKNRARPAQAPETQQPPAPVRDPNREITTDLAKRPITWGRNGAPDVRALTANQAVLAVYQVNGFTSPREATLKDTEDLKALVVAVVDKMSPDTLKRSQVPPGWSGFGLDELQAYLERPTYLVDFTPARPFVLENDVAEEEPLDETTPITQVEPPAPAHEPAEPHAARTKVSKILRASIIAKWNARRVSTQDRAEMVNLYDTTGEAKGRVEEMLAADGEEMLKSLGQDAE